MFEYKMIRSKSMGYAMFKRSNGFWQQVTKWYMYEGNLWRFNPHLKVPCLYQYAD